MFIDRKDGKITGVYARPQHKGQESIKDNAEELIAFQNPPKTEKQINEEKINLKTRELAIESLKTSGELPEDYK